MTKMVIKTKTLQYKDQHQDQTNTETVDKNKTQTNSFSKVPFQLGPLSLVHKEVEYVVQNNNNKMEQQ